MLRRTIAVAAVVLVGAAGLTGLAERRAEATDATVAPSQIVTRVGTVAGTVAALATETQSGSVIDQPNAVRFGPNRYTGERVYSVPSTVPLAGVWNLTIHTNVNGPAKAQQLWTWRLYNWRTKKWDKLGDNTEFRGDGTWQKVDFYVGGILTDYVDATTRAVNLRFQSPNKPYSLWVDSETVRFDYGPLPVHPGWKPPVGVRWQYELQPPVVTDICAVPWTGGDCVRPGVFDIDLYEEDGITPASATVDAVHALGARAVCYVSAGSWEDWRPDAAAFPTIVKGASNGWPGEKWLDIRRIDILEPIMAARADKCVEAGFDAIEWDNVDGFTNRTRFKLTGADQIRYNRMLADVTHARGVAVGLKNDVAQLTQLLPWFDFAINEQCQQYNECGGYNTWTANGKAVAQVEYTVGLGTFCPPTIAGGRSAIRKALDLQATPYTPCS